MLGASLVTVSLDARRCKTRSTFCGGQRPWKPIQAYGELACFFVTTLSVLLDPLSILCKKEEVRSCTRLKKHADDERAQNQLTLPISSSPAESCHLAAVEASVGQKLPADRLCFCLSNILNLAISWQVSQLMAGTVFMHQTNTRWPTALVT